MRRPRKRPHVRNPKSGFCPGCDDELGLPRRGSRLVQPVGIYGANRECLSCGALHISGPCSKPCVCRCRRCDARLDCRGDAEDWPKPLNEAARMRLPEHQR